jgi:hypothetical protein
MTERSLTATMGFDPTPTLLADGAVTAVPATLIDGLSVAPGDRVLASVRTPLVPIVTALALPGEYAPFVLSLAPRAYWRLSDASGVPQDSSGNGYHSDGHNALTYHAAGASAKTPYGVTLNGSSSWVSFPDASCDPDYNVDFAVAFWVKTTNNTAVDIVMEKWGIGLNRTPWAVTDNGNGTLNFSRWDGTHIPVVYTAVINNGVWHHVVCRKKGSELRCMTDGALNTAGTDTCNTAMTNIAPLSVGARSGGTNYWGGTLQEVAFWLGSVPDWDDFQIMYYIVAGF